MGSMQTTEPDATPDFRTEELFSVPSGCIPDAVTSDGHLVAFWQQPDGRVRFVWDGTAGEPFDGVPDMRDKLPAMFSSMDGAHLAYAGIRAEKVFIGRDDAEDPPLEGFSRSVPPVFSPDGRHLAYGAQHGSEYRLVVDGEIAGELPIAPIKAVFSSDGERLAFVEVSGTNEDTTEYRIVLDGIPGPWFRGMRNADGAMQFSPDSRRFVYYQLDGKGHAQWIVDGVPQRLTNDVRQIGLAQLRGVGVVEPPLIASFSPDSRRFVYFADVLERGVAILEDDGTGPLFKGVGRPVFSADSRHLAYVGQQDSDLLTLVIDGVPGPEWPGQDAGLPVFSGDGRHTALTIHRETGHFLRKRHHYALIVDGHTLTEVEGDDASLAPAFSPDATRVAWWVQHGEVPQVMVNDAPHADDAIGWGDPVFTSAGHLVYAAVVDQGSVTIMIDGRTGPLADVIEDRRSIASFDDPRTGRSTPTFDISADGTHVIWAGLFGDESRPVFDDRVGPSFDRVVSSAFARDGRATWWAQRGDVIYRVTA